MHRGFGVVEQHEPPDSERGELAAELRADRPSRPRHKDRLAAEPCDDLVERNFDFGPPQQVFDLDLADIGLHQLTVGHVVDRRGDQDFDAAAGAELDKPLALFLRRIVIGEKDTLYVVFVPHVTHVLGREEIVDGQVVDLVGTQARAVNDEAADVVVGRILQPRDERYGLVVYPVHHDAHAAVILQEVALDGVVGEDHGHTHGNQGAHREQQVERRIDVDVRVVGRQQRGKGRDQAEHEHHLENRRRPDFPHFPQRGVADYRAVGLEQEEAAHAEAAGHHAQQQVFVGAEYRIRRREGDGAHRGHDRSERRDADVDNEDQPRFEVLVEAESVR